MKKKRKIWLAVTFFAIAEAFAFPEILFSDCIRAKEVQQEKKTGAAADLSVWSQIRRESDLAREEEAQLEFEWKFWFLQ